MNPQVTGEPASDANPQSLRGFGPGAEPDPDRSVAAVPPSVLIGSVVSGRGRAASHIRLHAAELKSKIGRDLFLGSLNVILRTPVRLSPHTASTFSGGKRFIWRASLNGMPVWIYRWNYTALHAIEVLSDVHLRTKLDLHDGDEVRIEVDAGHVDGVSPLERVVWHLCWSGRRHWVYTNDRYYKAIKSVSKRFGATQIRRRDKRKIYQFTRDLLIDPAVPELVPVIQIQNLLNYTKTSESAYSAFEYPAGYHTININGMRLQGQRDPAMRMRAVELELEGKTVLDIGCNQGGMLFEISSVIKWGVGIDYDHRMINAANKIKYEKVSHNLSFFMFNLEKEPLELILDFMPAPKADIIFLLSVCAWLRNWREVVSFAATVADAMLFESNGSAEQRRQQRDLLETLYQSVVLVSEKSEDDEYQKNRELFYCVDPGR